MNHQFYCHWSRVENPSNPIGCVCGPDEEDEMPKLDDQTKVEILKSKEQQLIDAIAEAIDVEQKRLALDALQSVRAALRRCEGANDTTNP